MSSTFMQHVQALLHSHARAAGDAAAQESSAALLQITRDIIGAGGQQPRTATTSEALQSARIALAELLHNVSVGTDWSSLV